MQHLPLHPQGPSLSRVIAGAWRWTNLPEDQLDRLIRTCLDQGITTFDHADIYGDYSNERSFGQAIGRDRSLAKKMQIVTKCGIRLTSSARPEHRVKHYDSSKEHIIASAESSLRLLGVEKIDVLLIHRPDPLMDVDQVAEAFSQLKHQGKVLHFGVSNFTNPQFDLLQSALSFPLVTNQIELSLLRVAPLFDGTIDHLYKHKVSAMAWSPLGGGKTFAAEDENSIRIRATIKRIASNYGGASESQFYLAWLLTHPSGIFPVIGTSRPERIVDAAGSVHVNLGREDWFDLLKAARGHDVA